MEGKGEGVVERRDEREGIGRGCVLEGLLRSRGWCIGGVGGRRVGEGWCWWVEVLGLQLERFPQEGGNLGYRSMEWLPRENVTFEG